ncbi:hypothetical protein [Marinicella marina]|uniref:hypothetical protein n=1 Tax=Marinicella marina TaxID=2996016 RepID=UPI0024BD39F3|nr:hypothetical protein [Marinicella marina]MDJ1139656.1 hypothetical protein [Marinicella marina]
MTTKKKAKLVTPKAVVTWGKSLTNEGEFDGKKTGKYEGKLRFDPSLPDHAEFIEFLRESISTDVDAYLEDLKKSDPKKHKIQSKWERKDPFTEELDDQGDETGMLLCKFTRSVKKGLATFVDSGKTKMKKVPDVYGGAEIKIAYGFGKVYAMGSSKLVGVPLYMNAVQVITLGGNSGGNENDFDEEDGYEYDDSVAEDQADSEGTDDEEEDF